MTTKAKPKFYFNNIKFNSSYYDTEIDDNIPRPINQSTSTVNSVLTLTNLSPIQTSWITIPTQITSYVDFNNTTKILNSNVSGNIVDLILSSSIGVSTAQKFVLPSNTSTAINNSVLTINSSNKTTQWLAIPTQITDYVNYNNTTKILNSSVSGNIVDLILSSSIGLSTAQKFVLPSNTSSAINNSVLTINSSNKTTQWLTIPTQITDYVDYNDVKDTLIRYNNNILGPETITDLVIGSIGSNISQKFVLPSNTSTSSIGQVLSILDATTKTTQWITIPTQISSYVNYNSLNSNLISNVSGTPTTISSITISGLLTSGNINSGAIDANSNLIQTTGNLQSRGLTIKNISNSNVLTISNLGDINSAGAYSGANYIYTSSGDIQTASGDIYTNTGELRSRGLKIKNTSNVDVATISNLGALVCTTIQNNNNTLNCGNITSGSINCTTITTNNNTLNCGNITSGSINCTTITTNNNTINSGTGSISGGALSCTTLTSSTSNGLTSQGLVVKNGSTTNASLSNLGVLTCKAIQNNGNTLGCGNITCGSIDTINNEIDCGTGTVFAGIFSASGDSVLNSGTSSSKISIGSNQGSGSIDIGMNGGRSGDINIGYPTVSGSINIGRPIRMPGLVYTNSLEIGYSQNITETYSTSTGNGTESGIRKITTLPVLINNANYLINYSLQIDPLANFNATKLQFGIYRTTIFTDPIPNLSQNLHMLSGSTGATTTRYITAELYCYSGSGFLKYNSISTYSFSHIITFTGTVPTIIVNIDIIRIS
jgi:hypothetical protein